MNIKNAIIDNATIKIHKPTGVVFIWIYLDDGSAIQGYVVSSKYVEIDTFLKNLMNVADVTNWDNLKGKAVRFKINSINSNIISIGHFLKDEWLPDSIIT